MASILNVDQINNAAGTSAVTIDASTGKPSFPNGAILPAGSVIQVVNTLSDTRTSSTSTSYTAATDLAATITPTSSSSKICVQYDVSYRVYNNAGNDSMMVIGISKDGGSTVLAQNRLRSYDYGGSGSITESSVSISFLDSPATTNALTYQVYIKLTAGLNATINNDTPEANSSVTLMEIAQ
jgi:hypothetical protein